MAFLCYDDEGLISQSQFIMRYDTVCCAVYFGSVILKLQLQNVGSPQHEMLIDSGVGLDTSLISISFCGAEINTFKVYHT
jgi:hypothetical protein